MNTCDTCKHWKECDWMSDEDEVRGLCNHPMVFRPTYGPERNNMNHTDTWKPDRVYTCDEGGGTGEFCTGPKFGCIHYQSGAVAPAPLGHIGALKGQRGEVKQP